MKTWPVLVAAVDSCCYRCSLSRLPLPFTKPTLRFLAVANHLYSMHRLLSLDYRSRTLAFLLRGNKQRNINKKTPPHRRNDEQITLDFLCDQAFAHAHDMATDAGVVRAVGPLDTLQYMTLYDKVYSSTVCYIMCNNFIYIYIYIYPSRRAA